MRSSLPRTIARFARSVRVRDAFLRFFRLESASAIVMLGCAVIAIVLANSALNESVEAFWNTPVGTSLPPWLHGRSIREWVDEGLMAVFFFTVGLEIKRELVVGELSSLRRAALPVVAAFGGMIVPMALYLAVNAGGPAARGWAVPMATDIAFAVGVLALLGSRVPRGLKVFLVALAIADDLGAIVVIALFYSAPPAMGWLAASLVVVASMVGMNRAGVTRVWAYVLAAVVLWVCVANTGVHPTIAGVLAALTVPARGERSPLHRLEHGLGPLSAFVVLPLFALANAGVRVVDAGPDALVTPIAAGIALGLLVGKPVGIVVFSWIAVRSGLGRLPGGVTWAWMAGTGMLGGIGFTMAIFVSGLAFSDPVSLMAAKTAVLISSVVAGILGLATLSMRSSRTV